MKAYSTVIFPILLAITVCACQPSVGTGPILPPKEQTNTPSVQSGCASLAPETTDFNFEGLKAEIDSIGTTVGGGGFQKSVTSVYNVSEPYTKCIQHETFRYILDKDPIPMEALCFVNSADQSSFESCLSLANNYEGKTTCNNMLRLADSFIQKPGDAEAVVSAKLKNVQDTISKYQTCLDKENEKQEEDRKKKDEQSCIKKIESELAG